MTDLPTKTELDKTEIDAARELLATEAVDSGEDQSGALRHYLERALDAVEALQAECCENEIAYADLVVALSRRDPERDSAHES